jgi:hypothetical protein
MNATLLKKSLLLSFVGFVILFLLRLAYGYTKDPKEFDLGFGSDADRWGSMGYEKKNYASSKKYDYDTPQNGGFERTPNSGEGQKYEKICTSTSYSEAFDSDEKRLRDLIESNQSLIQFEKKSGMAGSRMLDMGIGVPPTLFDTFVSSVQSIGKITSLTIDKTDKTNEYRQLQAALASLQSTKTSLIELKTKGGNIEEYINLENRIMELEEKIQSLGVNLGDFDSENEFCTVRFSLIEKSAIKAISTPYRIYVAFCWTAKYYALILLAFISMSVLLLITLTLKRLITGK